VKGRLAILLAAVPLAALAGCGDGDSSDANDVASKPANEIVADSAAALSKVRSFHAEGNQGGTQVVADLELPQTLRILLRDKATSASIIAVEGSVYIKADEAYWKQQGVGRAAPKLAGKWLKSPTTTAELRDLTKGLDPETLSRCLTKEHGTLAKGGEETVDGQKAVVVVDKGDKPGTAPGKLYVAATGDPLPLRTLATGNERPGGKKDPSCDSDGSRTKKGDETKFSRYNESFDIAAPPGAVAIGGSGTRS
jgi:hypothetical protein